MIKSYYLAKLLFKLRLPSFNHCEIDKTAKVSSGSVLARVRMGRYSYIGANTSVTDVNIGSFCSIAGDCHIGGGFHSTATVSTSPVFFGGRNFLKTNFANLPNVLPKIVEIGNDVWIGSGVYVKAGVKIGTGAVVGANAVVTHDVEPYSIIAGVPAGEIRKRFDDETIQKLLALAWWDWSEEKLKQYGEFFSDPEKLLCVAENE